MGMSLPFHLAHFSCLTLSRICFLQVRRPFAWINSRMHVQRLKDQSEYIHDAEASLETFGEVQQIWHPWRRRYDLFLRFGTVFTLHILLG